MGGERDTFRQLERANRRRTAELVAIFVLIYAVCGYGLDFVFHTIRVVDHQLTGFPWLMIAGVVTASIQAVWAYYLGSSSVIRAVQGDDLTPSSVKEQGVVDVVSEMALAARMPTPRVCLMEDPAPNAFACGRDPEHSVICVTRGLVDQLDREELQGAIAHEMAHIRGHDTRITQMTVVMVGGFALLAALPFRLYASQQRGDSEIPGLGLLTIPLLILGAFGWCFSKMAAIALSREREYLADAASVEFTRNPTALIRALEHIARIESPLKAALRGVAPLFIVDPFECGGKGWTDYLDDIAQIESRQDLTKEQRDAEAAAYMVKGMPQVSFQNPFSSHPPIRDRIARLRGLLQQPSGVPGQPPAETSAEVLAKRKAAAKVVIENTKSNPEVAAAFMTSMIQANPAAQLIRQLGLPPAMGVSAPGPTEDKPYSDASEEATYQKLYEYNLGLTGDKAQPSPGQAPSLAAPLEALKRMDPAQLQAIMAAGFAAAQKKPAKQSTAVSAGVAGERPPSRKLRNLFWIVIALSAGAIIASFAIS